MELVKDERPLILRMIWEIDQAGPVGEHRREMWESCWRENVRPPYFDRASVVRRHLKLYRIDGGYEAFFLKGLLQKLASHWLKGLPVVEFGCGPGTNLDVLRDVQIGPLLGLDWSESAVRRVRSRGHDAGYFDFFHPERHSVLHLKGSAFLTVHALEQIGRRWEPWLDFVLEQKPAIVVHIEPLYELYAPDELLDNLAMRYHERREYLTGYLPAVHMLGDVLDVHRTFVGSLNHEAYSILIWRPK